jgi:hypothetical protein
VAGSGRHGGIPVEGGSGGVAASSGAVRWLETEARGGLRHGVGAEKKNTTWGGGGIKPVAAQFPFKRAQRERGGVGERGTRVTHGVEQGRERGASTVENGSGGRRARAAALPRYSGGRRDASG